MSKRKGRVDPTAVWRDGWRDRVGALLRARGFETAVAFGRAHPETDYVGLAELLGDLVAPIQLMSLLREECASAGRFDEFVADSFCRQAIRHGATAGARSVTEFGLASVFADWRASLGEANADQALAVWQAIHPRLVNGWRPTGPRDAILQSAIQLEAWAVP